ncbi:MAG: 50S ribosomal protein L9 [Nitriliruptoraceae bacterium]
MKVILKSEVDNLGLAGDVVDVADGYGRNYLLPRGLAIVATKGAMKEAKAILRSRKAKESETLDEAQEAKDILESRTLRIAARVDERGSLYGSVSSQDIHRVLKERGHDIERKRIELKGTIKRIGSYEVPVHVHPQVVAMVPVEVVDEEGVVGVEPATVVDEDVTDAAADAAEGTDSDADVLAEQALEAAQEYEQRQAELEAEREAAGLAPDTATGSGGDEDDEPV